MELGLQTMLNGLAASSFYMMVAVGLALIFGVMQMANLAHGEFFMAGAYTVWLTYTLRGVPFFVAVLAGVGVVIGLGLATERLIFRPLRGQLVTGYIATGGLMLVMQVIAGQAWGVGLAKPVAPVIQGSLNILGAYIGWQRFLIIPAAIVSFGLLQLFLHKTRLGCALRATSQDPVAAALQGININKMSLLAMGIGSAFAGFAGGMMSPIYPVDPYVGQGIILVAFVVIIIGGMSSIIGAVVASFILGFIHTVVATVQDVNLANMIGVIFMLCVLAIKPEGLLSHAKR